MEPYSLIQTIKPKTLAISLDEAKLFLKVEHDIEDQLITSLIKAVTQKCERYTSKALISQQWQVSYRQCGENTLTLPITLVLSVDEVKLYNFTHDSTILNQSLYRHDGDDICFMALPFSHKLSITYTAGFGSSSHDIPAELQAIMLEHLAYLYENRNTIINFPMEKYNDYKTFKL